MPRPPCPARPLPPCSLPKKVRRRQDELCREEVFSMLSMTAAVLVSVLLGSALTPSVAVAAQTPGMVNESGECSMMPAPLAPPPSSDHTGTAGGEHDHAGTPVSPYHVLRIGEASHTDRAIRLSESAHETGTVKAAVVVNGSSFPDSISAASLAGTVKGPVLPVGKRTVSRAVIRELTRLGVRRVYVVGGTASVSSEVSAALARRGIRISRVGGGNRYETAAAVARKVRSLRSSTSIDTVFVVSAEKPWDALSVSAYAYSQRMPILLVDGRGIPDVTRRAIKVLRPKRLVVVGTGNAISGTTFRKLSAMTRGQDSLVTGASRFNTAAATAQHAIRQGWAHARHPVIANGVNQFADGLFGAAHAGTEGSVFLLTSSFALPMRTSKLISSTRLSVKHAMIVGTTEAIEPSVEVEVDKLLSGQGHHGHGS